MCVVSCSMQFKTLISKCQLSTFLRNSGIQQKLDYFESLGVGSLWLTPIYPSPMKDNGYDIKDYNNIDPLFGNLADFKVKYFSVYLNKK